MDLTGNDNFYEESDNFLGLGKKAKEQRVAKKVAKQEAKDLGLKGRAVRLAGRVAKKEVKADQKMDAGKVKASARISGRATQLAKKSDIIADTGKNILNKDLRVTARKAGQDTQADILNTAVQTGMVTGKKAEKVLKKATQVKERDGKTAIQRGIEKGVFAPILPFKSAMVTALKDNGVNVSKLDSIDKIANLFYNDVIKKSNGSVAHFEVDLNNTPNSDHAIGTAVTVIIDAVIGFFQKSKEKKDTNQPLTKSEKIAAGAVEKLDQKTAEEVDKKVNFEIGNFVTDNWMLIAGCVAVVVLLMVTKS